MWSILDVFLDSGGGNLVKWDSLIYIYLKKSSLTWKYDIHYILDHFHYNPYKLKLLNDDPSIKNSEKRIQIIPNITYHNQTEELKHLFVADQKFDLKDVTDGYKLLYTNKTINSPDSEISDLFDSKVSTKKKHLLFRFLSREEPLKKPLTAENKTTLLITLATPLKNQHRTMENDILKLYKNNIQTLQSRSIEVKTKIIAFFSSHKQGALFFIDTNSKHDALNEDLLNARKLLSNTQKSKLKTAKVSVLHQNMDADFYQSLKQLLCFNDSDEKLAEFKIIFLKRLFNILNEHLPMQDFILKSNTTSKLSTMTEEFCHLKFSDKSLPPHIQLDKEDLTNFKYPIILYNINHNYRFIDGHYSLKTFNNLIQLNLSTEQASVCLPFLYILALPISTVYKESKLFYKNKLEQIWPPALYFLLDQFDAFDVYYIAEYYQLYLKNQPQKPLYESTTTPSKINKPLSQTTSIPTPTIHKTTPLTKSAPMSSTPLIKTTQIPTKRTVPHLQDQTTTATKKVKNNEEINRNLSPLPIVEKSSNDKHYLKMVHILIFFKSIKDETKIISRCSNIELKITDILTLLPDEYINCRIIEYFNKYFSNMYDQEKTVNVWSTDFYTKLGRSFKEQNFESLFRWHKNKKNKDSAHELNSNIIIIPINQACHWFVLVLLDFAKVIDDCNQKTKLTSKMCQMIVLDSNNDNRRDLPDIKALFVKYFSKYLKLDENELRNAIDIKQVKCVKQERFDCGIHAISNIASILKHKSTIKEKMLQNGSQWWKVETVYSRDELLSMIYNKREIEK